MSSSAARPSSGASTTRAVRRPEGRSGAADAEEQKPAYEEINEDIAEFVPGVPLAHPAPSLAFAKGVEGYVASPVQDEVWNNVTVTR